jgi:hypothetical protein
MKGGRSTMAGIPGQPGRSESSDAQRKASADNLAKANEARLRTLGILRDIEQLDTTIEMAEAEWAEVPGLIRRTLTLKDELAAEQVHAEARLKFLCETVGVPVPQDVPEAPKDEPEAATEEVGDGFGEASKVSTADSLIAPTRTSTHAEQPEPEYQVKADAQPGKEDPDAPDELHPDPKVKVIDEGGIANLSVTGEGSIDTALMPKPAPVVEPPRLWAPAYGEGATSNSRYRKEFGEFPIYLPGCKPEMFNDYLFHLSRTDSVMLSVKREPRERRQKAKPGLSIPGPVNDVVDRFAKDLAAGAERRGWRKEFNSLVREAGWKKATGSLWKRVVERAKKINGELLTPHQMRVLAAEANAVQHNRLLNSLGTFMLALPRVETATRIRLARERRNHR